MTLYITADENGYTDLISTAEKDLGISNQQNGIKLYNENGSHLQKEDVYSVNQNDVFYVTKRGREFNW